MNNADQTQIAYGLRQALNETVERLPDEVLVGLQENRQAALGAFRQRQERQNSRLAHTLVLAAFPLRLLVITTALSLGLVGTYYWDKFEQASENEEIDSALLSEDLPPEIYTDTGFHSWLENSRTSSSH